MTAPDLPVTAPPGRRAAIERWRRRSRLVRSVRIALPAAIALILAGLAASVGYNALVGAPEQAQDADAPIRLVNPRFVGRDAEGRGFVLTAASAVRDQQDYQRVILDRPALVLDEQGPDSLRISSRSGVFHEGTGQLQLSGGVRLSGAQAMFETAASSFDTKTGVLTGSGPIQGTGSLGEIDAKSYAVYGKGERMVFKGGVRARIETK